MSVGIRLIVINKLLTQSRKRGNKHDNRTRLWGNCGDLGRWRKLENKDKIILDLAGGTGAWSKPYLDAGYDVRIITLPDYDVTDVVFSKDYMVFNKQKYKQSYNVNDMGIEYKNIYGILAAPPCTMFSIARNDKTAKKPRDLKEGMRIVNACLEIVHECLYFSHRLGGEGIKFWALENPYTGYLKRFLGKPPLVFNPCDYGDFYNKKTALWGEFKNLELNKVEPLELNYVKYAASRNKIRTEKEAQIPEGYQEKTGLGKRKIMRSITPQGFAKAFYKANK